MTNNIIEHVLRVAILAFNERRHNPRRQHSTLGYLSPIHYERRRGIEG